MIDCKKRLFIILSVTLIFIFNIISVANADNRAEKVQAYMGVKVQYNGQELMADQQPYIINNTTYVPLRMLMEKFDKDISYDPSSYKVIIKDRENTAEVSLNQKIAELNAKIASLQSENSKLKTENASLTAENTSLKNKITILQYYDDELTDIEDELYEDYEDAGNDYFDDDDIELSISLDGDEDELEFEINLYFYDSYENNDMTELSSTDIKSLMNAVYDDIEEYIEDTDYEDADITGYMEDDNDYYVEYDGSTFDFSW